MTPLYAIARKPPIEQPYHLHYSEPMKQNWWSLDVIQRSAFEEAKHLLDPIDGDYNPRFSDECADVDDAGSAIWAFAETAWDWLPDLRASGCRIADQVRVKRGRKQYKLVYCAPILDLLDQDNSNLSWNGGLISWVTDTHLYEWEGAPPLMFQVLFHNREEYRDVMARPSMRCFVSQAFVDEYQRRGLTGVDFHLVPRTKRPPHAPEPKSVVVHRPSRRDLN